MLAPNDVYVDLPISAYNDKANFVNAILDSFDEVVSEKYENYLSNCFYYAYNVTGSKAELKVLRPRLWAYQNLSAEWLVPVADRYLGGDKSLPELLAYLMNTGSIFTPENFSQVEVSLARLSSRIGSMKSLEPFTPINDPNEMAFLRLVAAAVMLDVEDIGLVEALVNAALPELTSLSKLELVKLVKAPENVFAMDIINRAHDELRSRVSPNALVSATMEMVNKKT